MGLFEEVYYSPSPNTDGAMLSLARELRRLAPRMLYYLPPMPRTFWQVIRDWIFFRGVCRIRHFVGLRPTPSYPIRGKNGSLPRMERESDRLLAWIGNGLPEVNHGRVNQAPWLIPTSEDGAQIRALLTQAGFLSYPLAAICPGAKKETQRWPEERFCALGKLLLETYPDLRLLILGGQEDQRLGNYFSHSWGNACLNLAGILNVWESAAALQLCSLYIGNDTGTMHLAASVGTPCVAIFSARENPGRWEPSGENHTIIRQDVPCEGCYRSSCIENNLACLKSIMVEAVNEKVSSYSFLK